MAYLSVFTEMLLSKAWPTTQSAITKPASSLTLFICKVPALNDRTLLFLSIHRRFSRQV